VSDEAREFKVRQAGDRALLIELSSNAEVHRYAAAVRERLGAAAEDVVPGHETVLVSSASGAPPLAELELIFNGLSDHDEAAATNEVRIPVIYDGPDLGEVASATGLSVAELCELHASRTYTAAFIGFAPGFAYLLANDQRLRVPRRQTPRVKVPRGSVAIAGEYSAVYPAESPGGWNIIGRTEAVLFDASQDGPYLLQPGTRVRFEPLS
jgi:KipI family sensor histidine kinase inhibitor